MKLLLLIISIVPLAAVGQETPNFTNDVWPILTQNCIKCHGERNQEGDLRLDSPQAIREGGEYGAIVEPGDPGDSTLFELVTSTDDERMPSKGDPLPPESIEILRQWIESGSNFDGWQPEFTAIANASIQQNHWAFTAPKRPGLPASVTNPIDHFVRIQAESNGLKLSKPAEKLTLIRRLALDLTGLPPTPQEVDRILALPENSWYATYVDELLASPHYGERWARHWLDAAQYADSDGFEKDKPRAVSAWRDWVINAFNSDMPYNQFIVEQIAGDLLPNATQDNRVATGFLRNSMINEEGGVHPEQFRMEAMFNRMDLIGRAVLGLTVGCAQCHDHKYDPLSHTDYFRMMAFINNSHEAQITVYTPEESDTKNDVLAAIHTLEKSVDTQSRRVRKSSKAWEKSILAQPNPEWEVLDLTFDDSSAGGQRSLPQADGSYLAQGYAPTRFDPKMLAVPKTRRITAVRLELLSDNNLPRGGPGRSIYGTAALAEIELRHAPVEREIREWGSWDKTIFDSAIADVNPAEKKLGPEWPNKGEDKRVTGPIAMAIDRKGDTAWTTDNGAGRRNQAREAIFTLKHPLELVEGEQIAINLSQKHGGWNSDDNQNYNIGRFRLSITSADELPSEITSDALLQALSTPENNRSDEQNALIHRRWLTATPQQDEFNIKLDETWARHPLGATQLVMMEQDQPRITHRLDRGDYLSPEEVVNQGTPGFLHTLDTSAPTNRLTFAQWLASPDSPTTARTIVNRVWQQYFGTGIVATPSDFGVQGERPTHPELLDWLAVEFMENDWSLKQLHKRITESQTYQQSSHLTPEALERDPDNRYLARASRIRVEGEVVRDIALASSGLLNPKVGGPSVHPPAPDYLFVPPASYGPKVWKASDDTEKYRRALYTFRFRSVPYPVLQIFDTPAGNAPCTLRDRSNTPLQALATLNEPLFNECAAALGTQSMLHGGNSDASRIDYAFRSAVTRPPDATETETLQRFLVNQRGRINSGELDATKLVPDGDDLSERAAWALTARVILNLDETITRQ